MKFLFGLFFLLYFCCQVQASHVPGGNITYKCVGVNQYEVTLTLFEDCETAFEGSAPQSINISNDCGFTQVVSVLLYSVVYHKEVSQLCASALSQSECSGGPLPGIYLSQWTGIITLPGQCDSWRFTYSNCCRNASTNLVGALSDYYFEAVLNSATSLCNTSPVVTTQLIPYVCVNQSLVYNLGVYEPDGNTLMYTLVDALTSQGVSVPYSGAYSGSSPINGISINSNTGDLTFTPTIIGNFVVSVLVEEFDVNNNFVGSILQDFQFEVINCPSNMNPIEPTGVTNYIGEGTLVAPNEISMCAGDSFCFDITFTDLNTSDSIFIGSNINLALPGATLTQTSWTSPASATVCWQANNSVANNTSVVFNARDNACLIFGFTFFPVIVNILESTHLGPDLTVCYGDSVGITATGGTEFTWSALSGGDPLLVGSNFSCDTCSMVFACPDSTTSYVVSSNLGGTCDNNDTVNVAIVDNYSYNINQSTDSCCIGEVVEFNISIGSSGVYDYSWTPSGLLDSDTIQNPVFVANSSGEYEFYSNLTGPSGCVKYDTLHVFVDTLIGVSAGLDKILCLGDSVSLNGSLPDNVLWSSVPGGDDLLLGTNFSCDTCQFPYASPNVSTQYEISVPTVGYCQERDTVLVEVVSTIDYALTQNRVISCLEDTVELNLDVSTMDPYSFNWSPGALLDDSTLLNPIVLQQDFGTYTVDVEIVNSFGCVKNDSVTFSFTEGYHPIVSLNTIKDTVSCADSLLVNVDFEVTPIPFCRTSSLTGCGSLADSAFVTNGVQALDTLNSQFFEPLINSVYKRLIQYVFRASELQALGVNSGRITGLSWEILSIIDQEEIDNLSISVGCTMDSVITDSIQGLSRMLFESTYTIQDGWNNFNFDSSYNWDGSSNLVISITSNNAGSPYFSNNAITGMDSLSFYCTYATAFFGTQSFNRKYRPKTKFKFCPLEVDPSEYSFTWSSTSQDTSSIYFNAQQSSTAQVIVTENYSGCSDTASKTINITCCQTPLASSIEPTCRDGGDGSINVMANSDISGPYSYELLDPISLVVLQMEQNVIADTSFTGLTPGDYLVSAIDADGCRKDTLVTVGNTPLISVDAGANSSVCLNDSIQLLASGGNQFSWGATNQLSDLNIGNPYFYGGSEEMLYVMITDVNGCSNVDSVYLSINSLPIANAGEDVWLCKGFDTQLNGAGGVSYLWSPTITLDDPNIFNPLASPIDTTEYVLTVTDVNGCKNKDSLFVFANGFVPTFAGNDTIICEGDSLYLGGYPASVGGSAFAWEPGGLVNNPSLANPLAFPVEDTWFYLSTTNDTCIGIDSVFITVNPYPLANAGMDIQMCIGDTVQLGATGGIDFLWSASSDLSNESIFNPLVWAVDTTDFIVKVTDVLGCSQYDTVAVVVNPLPIISAGADESICFGDTLQLLASGGELYEWLPSGFISGLTINNPFVWPFATTLFEVIVADSNGCVNSDEVEITVFDLPLVDAGVDMAICIDDTTQLQGSNAISFDWQPNLFISNNSIENPSIWPIESMNYYLNGTDDNGCENIDSVYVSVYELPNPYFGYVITPSCEGVVVEMTDSSSLTDFYAWTFSNGEISTEASPTIIFEYGGDFTMQLTASNQYGCTSVIDTTAVAGSFVDYYDIHIPNVFTPNGDHENDFFWIETPGQLSQCLELNVFNRWGQLIFKSAGNVISWDGKTSTGQDVPEGTYMFTVVLKEYVYEGTVSLFR